MADSNKWNSLPDLPTEAEIVTIGQLSRQGGAIMLFLGCTLLQIFRFTYIVYIWHLTQRPGGNKFS